MAWRVVVRCGAASYRALSHEPAIYRDLFRRDNRGRMSRVLNTVAHETQAKIQLERWPPARRLSSSVCLSRRGRAQFVVPVNFPSVGRVRSHAFKRLPVPNGRTVLSRRSFSAEFPLVPFPRLIAHLHSNHVANSLRFVFFFSLIICLSFFIYFFVFDWFPVCIRFLMNLFGDRIFLKKKFVTEFDD